MRRFVVVALVLFSLSAAVEAQQLPQLTWVRYYQHPGEITATAKMQLDPLLAAGKIAGWGILAPMSRLDEEWTQALFVTVRDWAALEAATAALEGMKAAPAHDVVLRHVIQSQTPPVARPRYAVINYHPVTRGRDTDAYALFNEWAKPVFDKLTATGKLGPWGQSVQSIVLDNKWTYMVWYFMTDLSVLDDVTNELVALGPAKLGTYERRLREMSEDDYIGQLMRVVHWAAAPPP